jgi:hypothetical protein
MFLSNEEKSVCTHQNLLIPQLQDLTGNKCACAVVMHKIHQAHLCNAHGHGHCFVVCTGGHHNLDDPEKFNKCVTQVVGALSTNFKQ